MDGTGNGAEPARSAIPAEAAGTSSLPASQLPWQQIPSFNPQETDIQVYSRKLQFLKAIWPPEHVSQLAPRAALQVEGVAFQKVARLDPQTLRSEGGVQYLVEALGGQWGKLASEEKLAYFEKAIYQTIQRSDETNDSYLARHDVAFEDLASHKVPMEEIRAYVLLRQSQLSSEDRKRIILENKGDLSYENARKALRLLGAKFFQELQGVKPNKKTYDINITDGASEETAMVLSENDGRDEDTVFQVMYDEGDEDAIFINDFEETLIEVAQESPELASCYATYLEARTRLRERARIRGFWPMSGPGASKGKGKKGKMGSKGTKFRSLADRIASSACRKCGQFGHWKRECPLNLTKGDNKGKGTTETISIAEALFAHPEDHEDQMPAMELIDELPESAEDLGTLGQNSGILTPHDASGVCEVEDCFMIDGDVQNFEGSKSNGLAVSTGILTKFKSTNQVFKGLLQSALSKCCRKHGHAVKLAPTAEPTRTSEPEDSEDTSLFSPAVILMSEECAGEAVIDTGASRSVIGSERVQGLLEALSGNVRTPIKKMASSVNFRFGNSGTLQSMYALCIPRRQKGWIRVEVVQGRTPFLVSNAIMKELGVMIDPRNKVLRFLGNSKTVALKTCRKNLLCVGVVDLLNIPSNETDWKHVEEIYQQEVNHKEKGDMTNEKVERSNIPPRTCMSTQSQFIVQDSPHVESCHTAISAKVQAQVELPSTPSPTDQSVQSNGKLKGDEVLISGTGSVRGRRPRSPIRSSVHGCTRSAVQSPTRDHESAAVGRDQDPLGSSTGTDICGGVQQSSLLHFPDPKPQSGVTVAEESTELRDCPAEVRNTESDSHSAIIGRIGAVIEVTDNHSTFGTSGKGRKRVGSDHQDRSIVRQCQEDSGIQADHIRLGAAQQDQDDRGTECRASATDPDTDCPPSEGAGARDTDSGGRGHLKRAPALLSEAQVQGLQAQIDQFVGVIEKDFNQIRQKANVLEPQKPTNQSRPVVLLEVYCEKESQLTQQMKRMGGIALRFTRLHGDLTTPEGINKLWSWVMMYEPEHIWVAPECRFWGSFSKFNMGRSVTTRNMIMQGRQGDICHLELCNQLYLFQVSNGRHFHLEQPRGSDMIKQPQLYDVHTGTLPAYFDMCQAGKLRGPYTDKFLRKQSQVLTTSRIVHGLLHNQRCPRDHEHQQIKGSVKAPGEPWVKVSAYAAAYTAVFARKVVQGIIKSLGMGEKPLILEELLVGEELSKGTKRPVAQEVLEMRRCRRRHGTKSPPFPEDMDEDSSTGAHVVDWKGVITSFERDVPRVGAAYFWRDDPRVVQLQEQYPQINIQFVLLCRGTERYRVPKNDIIRDDIPLRKTVVVHRQSGEVQDLGDFEEWQQLSKAKQVRKAVPAKISISVFGKRCLLDGPVVESQEMPDVEMHAPITQQEGSSVPSSMTILANSQQKTVEESQPEAEALVPGWAPKIVPRHGPAFRALGAQQRTDLVRLHRNLGHPDPARHAASPSRTGCRANCGARCSRYAV